MKAFPSSALKFIRSPVSRISFGLVMLTVSLLLVSDLLGLIPNANRNELKIRQALAESLALQVSLNSAREDQTKMQALFDSVQSRNQRIDSLAVVRHDGQQLIETGSHSAHWNLENEAKSTPTQTRVGIYNRDGKWAELQIVFAPLHKSVAVEGTRSSAFTWLVIYFCLGGFLAYFLFLKRILKELDPNQVLPDRVRSALDTLSEGLMILDTQGSIMFCNQSLADRLGVKPQKLIGTAGSGLRWLDSSVELNSQADVLPLSEEQLPWSRSLNGEGNELGTMIALEVSRGKIFKFAVNTSLIQSGKNNVRGVLVTLSDISEVEKQRNDLQKALSRLEVTQHEITRKNEELFKLATRDSLTDVLNRRAFFEAFDTLFDDSKAAQAELGCIMVDIDKFKNVNDTHGHGVGDLVIQYLASALVEHSGEEDVVARFGGEEFCMLLPDKSMIESSKIAEAIRSHIEQGIGSTFSDMLSITSSFGVSALPSEASNPQELLDQADRALYHAKENGRNRVALFSNGEIEMPDRADLAAGKTTSNTSDNTKVATNRQDTGSGDNDGQLPQQFDVDTAKSHKFTDLTRTQNSETTPEAAANDETKLDALSNVPPQFERRTNPAHQEQGQGAKVLYEQGFSIIQRHRLLFNIDNCIQRTQSENTVAALVVLDTRSIQKIASTLGYSVGTSYGSALVERLKNLLRSNDVISRSIQSTDEKDKAVGPDNGAQGADSGAMDVSTSVARSESDEIVMLISDIKSTENVSSIVERIQKSFDIPIEVDARELSIDSCMGISISPLDATNAAQMLQHASVACSEAVSSGRRNEYRFYSKELDDSVRRRFQLQSDIHRAAERGEFRLAYQPKFSLANGQLTGFEALLRWNHPSLGKISATEFISLAEELDLISIISKWSVCAAMDQVAGWRRQGYNQFTVAVNLSASELSDPDLVGYLISELESRDLTPDAVELEITETSGIESSAIASRLLHELSDYGFSIAIDDFGTGFASLNYLQLFPIDRIKIDRSFVSNVDTNERNAELVRAIISLGSCLNVSILAEGVETQEQLTFLHDYGCNEVQGYFLGKPMESDTVFMLAEEQQYVSQRILQSRMRLWGDSGAGPADGAHGYVTGSSSGTAHDTGIHDEVVTQPMGPAGRQRLPILPASGIGAIFNPFPGEARQQDDFEGNPAETTSAGKMTGTDG